MKQLLLGALGSQVHESLLKRWATPRAYSQGYTLLRVWGAGVSSQELQLWGPASHLSSSPEPGPRPAFLKFPLLLTLCGSQVRGLPAWLAWP